MQKELTSFSISGRRLAGRTALQIVPDLHSGGAERTTVDVAAALCEAGARCLVASRGGRMVSELQSKGGIWLPFPAATKNPFAMAFNSVRLARVIRDEGVDIVHARSRAAAWVAYYATRQTGTRFVTTYHGVYSGVSAIKLQYNAIMTSGDFVIANSDFVARRIAQLHPEASNRIIVIPRGADMRQFSPAAVDSRRVERVRDAWGVEAHRRIVLLPARLSNRKGHAILIEAARLLVADGLRDVRFVFVGDSHSETLKRAFDEQIAKAGLKGLVINAGYCDDMPAAYLASSVAVAPSTEPEAFGRVAIEAQAMGVPVVVSDHGASMEIVLAPPETAPNESTGWRVPPADPGALGQAIREALNLGASARDELTLRARKHVQSNFSVEGMCRSTLAVYESLLAV
jgi:glycosyltransferase involved in cell wall biosynthesis